MSLPRWMWSSCGPGPLQACPLMPATVIAERILATRAPKTWRNRRGGGIERDVECRVAVLRVNARAMAASMLGARTMASRGPGYPVCLCRAGHRSRLGHRSVSFWHEPGELVRNVIDERVERPGWHVEDP